MISMYEFDKEVLFTRERVTIASAADIRHLKSRAAENPRRRIRLCAHATPEDDLHEMLIVHGRDAYVRPHLHAQKPESFHVIEGIARLFLFDQDGAVERVADVGTPSSGRCFFSRIPAGVFHSFIILSDWLVFHETTLGPFEREQLVFAPWSPEETATEKVVAFQKHLLSLPISSPSSASKAR